MARTGLLAIALAPAIALSGCISLGGKVPEQLFVLTPDRTAPAGSTSAGTMADAIAVLEPSAPQKLDVARVPVQMSGARLAYLQDAVWVEKPARQFGRLLAETIRAGGKRFVVNGLDTQYQAATRLTGQLLEMGYDVPSQSAIVRFDAVLTRPDGSISTRRFESEVTGITSDALVVGPALNEAANNVAAQIADWVG